MQPMELGTVIARRELRTGDDKPVIVSLGAPVPYPGGDYCCPVHVEGIGDGQVRPIVGIDEMQALWLALKFAGAYVADKGLTWLNGDDLGFPE